MPPSSKTVTARGVHWPSLITALALLFWFFISADTSRLALLLLLGAALGITLQQATFGFAGAYRRFFVRRETSALYAQLLMLAVATLLFAPFLSSGEAFGMPVAGSLAPASVSVAVGAFMFGIGMQLGDGCGSGTLYKAGGGMPRMFVTLAAFCAGSFWASLDMGWWQQLPELETLTLATPLGYSAAAALQLVFIALLALGLTYWRDQQSVRHIPVTGWQRMLSGPWPLMAGALLLALLNLSTLITAGHPWSITWAFALWGAKSAMLFGWDPSGAPFWNAPFQQAALHADLLNDVTSLMNIGILLGALSAAGVAGRFSPSWHISLRSLLAAVIGGLLMGYGARIAYGCNIGAFFSGIASMSLHGWLWITTALIGSALGVRFRPYLGLKN